MTGQSQSVHVNSSDSISGSNDASTESLSGTASTPVTVVIDDDNEVSTSNQQLTENETSSEQFAILRVECLKAKTLRVCQIDSMDGNQESQQHTHKCISAGIHYISLLGSKPVSRPLDRSICHHCQRPLVPGVTRSWFTDILFDPDHVFQPSRPCCICKLHARHFHGNPSSSNLVSTLSASGNIRHSTQMLTNASCHEPCRTRRRRRLVILPNLQLLLLVRHPNHSQKCCAQHRVAKSTLQVLHVQAF